MLCLFKFHRPVGRQSEATTGECSESYPSTGNSGDAVAYCPHKAATRTNKQTKTKNETKQERNKESKKQNKQSKKQNKQTNKTKKQRDKQTKKHTKKTRKQRKEETKHWRNKGCTVLYCAISKARPPLSPNNKQTNKQTDCILRLGPRH